MICALLRYSDKPCFSSNGSRTHLSALRGRWTKPIFDGAINHFVIFYAHCLAREMIRLQRPQMFWKSSCNFSKQKAASCGYFPKEDSNPHSQNQNLKCYHYTIGESLAIISRLKKNVNTKKEKSPCVQCRFVRAIFKCIQAIEIFRFLHYNRNYECGKKRRAFCGNRCWLYDD